MQDKINLKVMLGICSKEMKEIVSKPDNQLRLMKLRDLYHESIDSERIQEDFNHGKQEETR